MSWLGKLLGGLVGKRRSHDDEYLATDTGAAAPSDAGPEDTVAMTEAPDHFADAPTVALETFEPSASKIVIIPAETPSVPDANTVPDRIDPDELLRQLGADLNQTNEDGQTPLMLAASRGDTETVDALLDAGADTSAPNDLAGTPLSLAAANRHFNVVLSFLSRCDGIDDLTAMGGSWALRSACSKGDERIVRALLEAGASAWINDQSDHHLRWTSLIFAARSGCAEVVSLLIEWGADLEKCDTEGWSALLWAGRESYRHLSTNQSGSVVVLAESGANPNVTDEFEMTPLMYAARAGDAPAVEALLAAGAATYPVNIYRETAEQCAEANGYLEIAYSICCHEILNSNTGLDATNEVQLPEPPVRPETLVTSDTHDGRSLKFLFDVLKARFYRTAFTYDDLPPAPPADGSETAHVGDEVSDVISVGLSPSRDRRPFLRQLQGIEFIRSVAPNSFELTDLGRGSSILVRGTDTSIFLIFDRDQMQIDFGREACTIIRDALRDEPGTFAFQDGHVYRGDLAKIVRNSSVVVPTPGRKKAKPTQPFGFIEPHILAMWSDANGALARLHDYLTIGFPEAYAGHMTLGATHLREDFQRSVSEQLFLTPAMEIVGGNLVSGYVEYFS